MKRSFHTVLKKDSVFTLAIAILWQVIFLFIGWLLSPEQGVLGHMIHWDAGWYIQIITYAYGSEASPASPAFYPLFPLIIAALSFVSFHAIPYEVLALLVNTAGGVACPPRTCPYYKKASLLDAFANSNACCFPELPLRVLPSRLL